MSVDTSNVLRVDALSQLPLSAPEQTRLGFCTLNDLSVPSLGILGPASLPVWISFPYLFIDLVTVY